VAVFKLNRTLGDNENSRNLAPASRKKIWCPRHPLNILAPVATIQSRDRVMKILAMQFRYFGDAVIMTPALRAIKEQVPNVALHVLVAEEVAPLFQRLPWLERVWAFPRARGKAKIKQAWPVIRALRRERFDRSVDFGSGDRGAIMSFLCGAHERLAPSFHDGFFGRRYCYTQTIPIPESLHEVRRNLHLLSAWGIGAPSSLELEIHTDPARDRAAAQLLPRPAIVCHLATGQIKKDWPLACWAEFYRRATSAGYEVIFSTGISPRDQAGLESLKKLAPEAPQLSPNPDLALFLAVLKRARLFIAGDTGPLHFAAGLGVPTIALFGPSVISQWAPLGQQHRVLQGGPCTCDGRVGICQSASPCMAAIAPEAVLQMVRQILPSSRVASGQAEAQAGSERAR
jgi:ADP-heptose:LPS heptosyltransferase